MNSWTNGYYSFPTAGQRDAQPINWFNQNLTSAFNNPSALRFNNYFSGASNPFAGQMFSSPYQANSGFGDGFNYQYRGW